MFNVNIFDQKLSEAKVRHENLNKQSINDQNFIKKRDKLAQNYKKRVDQFIVQMAYEPLVV